MSQALFRAALLDPGLAVPPGLTGPAGQAAGRRFDIYRNNVTVSLTDALRAGFPVVEALVGPEFFAALARDFLRAHPPTSPILQRYGTTLPAFLAAFPPVAHLPYLPDVARLELAVRDSYHAADTPPTRPDLLDDLAPDRLPQARLMLAPSLRLVRSDWPIHAIWAANMRGTEPPDHRFAQNVLVLRPGFDPQPLAVADAVAALVAALLAGRPLGDAVAAAGPELDLTAALVLLGTHNALAGLDIGTDA